MKHSILSLSLALALVSTVAFAQSGSPLLTQVDQTPNAKVADLKAQPATKAVTLVKLNRAAMDSTVISATIDGKDYRFVGKLESKDANGFENWNGRTEAGEMLMLTRSSAGVHGFVVGQKTYQFVNVDHRQAMIEVRKDMPRERGNDEVKPQPPAKLK